MEFRDQGARPHTVTSVSSYLPSFPFRSSLTKAKWAATLAYFKLTHEEGLLDAKPYFLDFWRDS